MFLYKEDFDKFQNALSGVIDFIRTGKVPEDTMFEPESDNFGEEGKIDVSFEDLDRA